MSTKSDTGITRIVLLVVNNNYEITFNFNCYKWFTMFHLHSHHICFIRIKCVNLMALNDYKH